MRLRRIHAASASTPTAVLRGAVLTAVMATVLAGMPLSANGTAAGRNHAGSTAGVSGDLIGVPGWWTAADAVASATRLEGPIRADTVLTATGGPYLLDSTVAIRSDASLTVEAGTVILLTDGGAFQATEASVKFAGTASNPILVRGLSDFANHPGHGTLLRTAPLQYPPASPLVTLDHVLVENNYGAVALSVGDVHLTDTRFVGPANPTYTYGEAGISPVGAPPPVLDHVEFTNQPYLHFAVDGVRITDSRFVARADQPSGLLSLYRGAHVSGSSLQAVVGGQAVCACFNFRDGTIYDVDAAGNYWHTSSEAGIEDLIYDNWDDENLGGRVQYSGWLSDEPVGSLFTPALLTPPSATATGPGEMTLSWQPPASDGGAGLTGYHVRVWRDSVLAAETSTGAGTLSTVVDGLVPGNGYRFQVRAENLVGASAWSWASPTTTAIDGPGTPREVVAARGDRAATVSWQPPGSDGGAPVTSWTVTARSASQEQPATSRTVAGDRRSVELAGLLNGETYAVTVTATNRAGTSPPSTPVQVTPAAVPGRVAQPAASVHGARVVLRWRPPSANGSPLLRYTILSEPGHLRQVGAGTHQLTYRSVAPGKYRFRVVAINDVGASEPSRPRVVVVRR